MPTDLTVKYGPETKVFLSSAAQSLMSIDTADVATELGSAAALAWEDIGFYRHPISRSEPIETFDVYKNFDIDHTKRGRQQRKTGSMVAAFQNTSTSIRKYLDKHCLMKIEWHVEGVGAVNEYEYLKGMRISNYTRDIPEGEVTERIDYNYADWGHRDGP